MNPPGKSLGLCPEGTKARSEAPLVSDSDVHNLNQMTSHKPQHISKRKFLTNNLHLYSVASPYKLRSSRGSNFNLHSIASSNTSWSREKLQRQKHMHSVTTLQCSDTLNGAERNMDGVVGVYEIQQQWFMTTMRVFKPDLCPSMHIAVSLATVRKVGWQGASESIMQLRQWIMQLRQLSPLQWIMRLTCIGHVLTCLMDCKTARTMKPDMQRICCLLHVARKRLS